MDGWCQTVSGHGQGDALEGKKERTRVEPEQRRFCKAAYSWQSNGWDQCHGKGGGR